MIYHKLGVSMKNIWKFIAFAVMATPLVGCNENPLFIINIDSKVYDSNNQIVEGSLIEVKKTYYWRITNFDVGNKERIPSGGLEIKLEIEFSNDELRENNEDLEGRNFGDFSFQRRGDIFESTRVLYSDSNIDFSGLNFKISQANLIAGTTSNDQVIKFSFIATNGDAVIRVNDSNLNTYEKPVYVTKTTYENIGFSLAAGGETYGLVYVNVPVGVRTIIVRAYEPLTRNVVVTPKTYNESSNPIVNPDEEYLLLNFYNLVLVGYGNNQQLASQARVVFEITYQESTNYLSANYQRGIDFSNLTYFEV